MDEVETDPFPHFVADAAVPPETVAAMVKHWPSDNAFSPEVAGNHVCWFSQTPKFRDEPTAIQAFWSECLADTGLAITRRVLNAFSPWITRRYGGSPGRVISSIGLMQADKGYLGHVVHNHHYHSPFWLATALLYLDDDASHHGTTLYKIVPPPADSPLDYQAWAAAQTMLWSRWENLVEAVNVSYRGNRLMAFLDGPTSYHGVKPLARPAKGHRRIFRMHISAGKEWCERLYGVPLDQYQSRLRPRVPCEDAEAIGWMRRDIEMISPASQTGARAPDEAIAITVV